MGTARREHYKLCGKSEREGGREGGHKHTERLGVVFHNEENKTKSEI